MAAKAYSPSDAMSQAEIGLDGMQKVQRLNAIFCKAPIPDAETAPRGRRICCEDGVVLQISPVVGDLAALPHAAGSFGLPAPGRRGAGFNPDALDKAAGTAFGVWTARPAGWVPEALPVPVAD